MEKEFKCIKSEGVLKIDPSKRPPMIYIKDGHVNVAANQISMSRKHRTTMLVDLLTLSWVSGISVLLMTIDNLSLLEIVVMVFLSGVMWICAFGKTICDFRNWMFTMNRLNERVGEWCCEDVVNTCNDLIKAGVKVASEEVERVKKGEGAEGEGEGYKETKVEWGVCH